MKRRRVLAGLGAGSLAAVGVGIGGLAATTEPAVAHQNQAETNTQGNDLEFRWSEMYNGNLIDGGLTNFTSDPPGMVIDLSDIKPDDTGVLGIEMIVRSGEDDPSVSPYFALDLKETAENGINEPERAAGDTSSGTGELQEYIDVEIWYDTGTMGLGNSNLENDMGESLISPDAEGTLGEVARDLPDTADPSSGLRLLPGNCLQTDDSVAIAFGWKFRNPKDPKVNITQTDSVVFDLIFRGEGNCS